MPARPAYTLVEVLIGSALLLGMLLVVGSLILWGMDASLVGQAQQKTQQDARTMLEAIRNDIGMSTKVPLPGTPLLGVSVLLPSSYLKLSTNDLYTQEVPSSTPLDFLSQNIVALTVQNPAQSSSTFIPSLLQDQNGQPEFALVVYYVTDSTGQDVTRYTQFDAEGNPVAASAVGISAANPSGRTQATEGGHILWKNVYNVTGTQPLMVDGGGWTVNFAALNGPNGQPVSVGKTANDPISCDQVISLDSGDAIEFTVHHSTNAQQLVDTTYGTIADRHVFRIDAVALRQVHTHLGQSHFKVAKMSDSAAIQSFQ
ncbi:MAG TPA: hypothetical protein VGO93_15630 [Candidatus Xenobia bacterium]